MLSVTGLSDRVVRKPPLNISVVTCELEPQSGHPLSKDLVWTLCATDIASMGKLLVLADRKVITGRKSGTLVTLTLMQNIIYCTMIFSLKAPVKQTSK